MTTSSPSAGAPPAPEPPDQIASDQLPEPVEVAVAIRVSPQKSFALPLFAALQSFVALLLPSLQ